MLVLSRKLGEKITVVCPDGTPLEVTVVDIDRGKIRLGFDAPNSYRIYRNELLPLVPAGEIKKESSS